MDVKLLQSQLCFKAAVGALSTMRLLLKPAAVRLTSRKWSLRNWIQALKIQELCSLGSGIFFITENWLRECTFFFFSFLFPVSNCFTLVTGAD